MSLDVLPLETRSLFLRRIVSDDAPDLFALSNEDAARTWLPSQIYRDESHARAAVEFLVGQYSRPGNPRRGAYVLAIDHKADRRTIGHVGFSPFGDDVEAGFAVAQRYQGQGLAAEAVVAACAWAITTFALDRILGITSAANTAARHTLVRAGFVHQEDRVQMFQGTEAPVGVYALVARSGTPCTRAEDTR